MSMELIKDLLSQERVFKCDYETGKFIKAYFDKFKPDYKANDIVRIEDRGGCHYIVELYGGENGCGKWSDYFHNLTKIFDKSNVEKSGKIEKIWLIRLENDCLDDVHTVYVGIRMK